MIGWKQKFELTNEMSGTALEDYLPIVSTDGGIILFRDGSMATGIQFEAPYTVTMGEEQVAGIFSGLRSVLNALPDNYDAQFVFTQHHRVVELKAAMKTNTAHEILDVYQKEFDSRLLNDISRGALRLLVGYMFIVRTHQFSFRELSARARIHIDETESAVSGTGFFSKIISAIRSRKADLMAVNRETFYAQDEMLTARRELWVQSEGVLNQFQQLKLAPRRLDERGVIDVFFSRWNPKAFDNGSSPRYADPDEDIPPTDSFLQGSFLWDTSGKQVPRGVFRMDGYLHRVLSVRMPPDQIHFPQFETITLHSGISNLEIVCNVRHGDSGKRIKRLELKLRQMQNSKDSPAFNALRDELVAELEELGRRAEKTWVASHFIHLWAADEDSLDKSTKDLLSAAEKAGRIQISPEDFALWGYWRASQPGWTQDGDRFRENYYNTRQLTGMLPFSGQPANLSNGKPIGALFETSCRSIYNLFPHDPALFNSPHALIIGGSGSGKSFLFNTFLAQYAKHDPRIVIVDLDSSYKPFCESMGGRFVEMDIRSTKNRINPLFITPGHKPDPEELRTMILFIEKLVVDSSKGERLNKVAVTYVEEALNLCINATSSHGKEFFIRDVREALNGMQKEAQDLGRRLQPWCEGGRYGTLFDGPSMLSLDAPITVFELKRVRDDADVCPVMVATIVQAVMAMAQRFQGKFKILGFDEAAFLLKDKITREFMELSYRTMRKNGVAVFGLSQSLNDWMVGENPEAFINNVSNLVLLKQQTDSAAAFIRKTFNLSNSEEEIITQLTAVPGVYAQFLLIQFTTQGRRSLLCYNRPTPLGYAMGTTSPMDRAKIESFHSAGMSLPQAVIKFSKEFPTGVKAKA